MLKRYSRRTMIKASTKICGGISTALLFGCSNTEEVKIQDSPIKIPIKTDIKESHALSNKSISLGSLSSESSNFNFINHIGQSLIYSRLVAIDPRKNYLYGDLANEIEIIDSTKLRFRLKDDAYFHPNADFLAQPVKSEDIQRSYLSSDDYFFSKVIDSIDIQNEKTFVINLNAPFAFFFDNLASIESNIYSQESYAGLDLKLGSGLFKFSTRDATSYLFEANRLTHRKNLPRLEKIIIHQYGNDREFDAAFRSQNIDIREHPDINSYQSIRPNIDITQQIRSSQRMIGLGLSLLPIKNKRRTRYIKAFQDKRVRLAISNALDRTAIAQLAEGTIASPIGHAHKADSLSVTDLDSFKFQNYDLAESKKLLDASGYKSLSFEILLNEDKKLLTLANLIKKQLSDINIKANLIVKNEDSWNRSFEFGDFETILFLSEPLESPEMALRLHLSDSLGGSGSRWGFSDPIFDSAVKKMYSEMLLTDRSERTLEAQKVLLQQIPAMLPLVTPFDHVSLNKDISGYEFNSYSFNFDWLAGHWNRV